MQRCLHLLQLTLTSLHFYFQNWSPAQTGSCHCQSLQHSLNFRSFLQAVPCSFPTQLLGLVFCHWLSVTTPPPPRRTLQVPAEKQTKATAAPSHYLSSLQLFTRPANWHLQSNSCKRQVCCALGTNTKRLFLSIFIAKTLSPLCTPSPHSFKPIRESNCGLFPIFHTY